MTVKNQEKTGMTKEFYNELIKKLQTEIKEMPVFPVNEMTERIINLYERITILVELRDKWIIENET
jgi:hypothetical protein